MATELNIAIGCASSHLHLTEVYQGFVFTSPENHIELPKLKACKSEWGQKTNTSFMEDGCTEFPIKIELIYLSYSECEFYSINSSLSTNIIRNFCNKYDSEIIIGLSPYGNVAVWIHSHNKSIIVNWLKGEIAEIKMSDFHPYISHISIKDYCSYYINNDPHVKNNLEKHGLPPRNLFDNYMKQFTYRYLPIYGKWNKEEEKWMKYEEDETEPEFEYIEEALYDGTHDKLHDDGLLKYHQAGKPKKLAVKWHIKKSEYTAYFWFEDERIREVFDKFYGAHPDTKTDFIIRIDAEKRKYELALYRYGLKEPQIIPEDVYQLLVFKNKFEDYRSDNYNQDRGAWIW